MYNMNWYEKRNSLIVERMKLDKFFTMFLDKFERQMGSDKTDTPIWDLYRKKLKEYDNVQHGIREAQYWINKEHHVQNC